MLFKFLDEGKRGKNVCISTQFVSLEKGNKILLLNRNKKPNIEIME